MKILTIFFISVLGINLFANEKSLIEQDLKFMYNQKINKCVEQDKNDYENLQKRIKSDKVIVSNQYFSDEQKNGVITTMIEDDLLLVFTNNEPLCNNLKEILTEKK